MRIAVRGVCPLLEVFDMPTSIRFYRDVLGFEVVEAAPPGDDCVPTWTRPTRTCASAARWWRSRRSADTA